MEPWEPDKVAQLVALIATGFAARWAYTTQFPPKDEEHTITVVWAAIWSGVIATLLQVIHYGMIPSVIHLLPRDGPEKSKEHAAYLSAYSAAALMMNLAIFSSLGFCAGRVSVSYAAAVRERKMGVDKRFPSSFKRFFGTLFSTERGFANACQYFLKVMAEQKWLIVETEKGTYLGYIKVHDAREEDNFYVVLHEACMFDDVAKAFPADPQWPAIMFRSDEIKAIAIYQQSTPKPVSIAPSTTPQM